MPVSSLIFSFLFLLLLVIYFYELPFSEDYLLHLTSRDFFLSFFLSIVAVCRKGVLDFLG